MREVEGEDFLCGLLLLYYKHNVRNSTNYSEFRPCEGGLIVGDLNIHLNYDSSSCKWFTVRGDSRDTRVC